MTTREAAKISAWPPEPHALLLAAPPAGQRLYKLIPVENLIRSTQGGYLHFNRADHYLDVARRQQKLDVETVRGLHQNSSR
jgi:hypothetical protein